MHKIPRRITAYTDEAAAFRQIHKKVLVLTGHGHIHGQLKMTTPRYTPH